MSMDDIEKLKARVERDPDSKLFLPLAEEYRKAGMLDDAISVLLRGLERQPGYTSARVALGKIYLERKMIEDARGEFEKVINAIPDNLYAHKKLAEIYRDIGEIDRALSEYKTVIQLNPLDEDARSFIEGVEKIEGEVPGTSIEPVESPPELTEKVTEIDIMEAPDKSEVTESLEGIEVTLEEGSIEEQPQERLEEESFKIPEDLGLGQPGEESYSEFIEPIEMIPEDMMDVRSGISETEGLGLSESIEPLEQVSEVLSETETIEEPPITEEFSFDEFSYGEKIESGTKDYLDFSEADGFVLGRQYYKALEGYKKMLKEFPDDRRILQRIAELKNLLKLLGKDQEIIMKLEALLEGIRRRRDEFFGSS